MLIGTLFAFSAWAETGAASAAGCEQVPESRRAQCERVLECMVIEDADVRRACIDAAQRRPEPSQATEELVRAEPHPELTPPTTGDDQAAVLIEPARGNDEQEPVVAEQETVVVEPAPVPAEPLPTRDERAPVIDDPPVIEELTVATEDTTSDQTPQPEAAPHSQEPAANFTGEVTRIHQSVMDRQLIALDNSYLFVSDQGRQARLKVGQTVTARQAKSRFRAGRSWRLTGPSRRPVDAFRIRCERDDIRAEDRRKCTQMLNR